MKNLFVALFAVFVGMGLLVGDAEAKRLGGGKSLGMQRESVKPSSPAAAPAAAPTAAAPVTAPAMAGAAAAAPKRSWLGPVAGLAAGLGLAALASHFGFGEGLANFMMILLLALAAFFVFRLLFRRKQPAAPALQYAGAGPAPIAPTQPAQFSAAPASAGSGPTANAAARIPPGFDVDGFVRQAKLNFIRMQAANDAGNLDDLREFTTPEIFAELKLALAERGTARQETDVARIEAEVLEVVDADQRYIVSVHFHGLLSEDGGPAAAFDEIWHLTKPADGSRGWVVAGIQQTH